MPSILRYKLDQEINLAKEVEATVIEYMPSFMLAYFERAKEMGIDIRCGADWDGDNRTKNQTFHDIVHFELR